ncbi:MAG: hypothetical protein O3A92_13845 [Verrucomicrobia bacterium]|nr:hypothetical protein [Verrucomicrobiota bacterium]
MRRWRDRCGGMPPGKQPPLPSALAEPLEAWLNVQRRAQLSPATIQTRRLHVTPERIRRVHLECHPRG